MAAIRRGRLGLLTFIGGLGSLFLGWYCEIDITFITKVFTSTGRQKYKLSQIKLYSTVGVIGPLFGDQFSNTTSKSVLFVKDWILPFAQSQHHLYNITVYLPVNGTTESNVIQIAAYVFVKFVVTENKTPTDVINTLARTAYRDRIEYTLRISSSSFGLNSWGARLESGIRVLDRAKPRHVGVVVAAASDEYNPSDMWEVVHRTHLDIFYYYFPSDIDELSGHHWIKHVYTDKMCFHLDKNQTVVQATPSSNIPTNKTQKRIILRGRNKILRFLSTDMNIISGQDNTSVIATNPQTNLGAVVVMAPRRNFGISEFHGPDADPGHLMFGPRFCLFLHMLQSVDKNLNLYQNTRYPIFIIVATDPYEDPEKIDAPYTPEDRKQIKRWAPNSDLHFIEIDMYTKDALTKGVTREQAIQWANGTDGGIGGRPFGYRSMCRGWSGRIQRMPFLQRYKYYLRLDDDSLFLTPLAKDPFKEMDKLSLQYAYVRRSKDSWGYEQLQVISKPYGTLSGVEVPYTNFHMARTDFFKRPVVLRYWSDLQHSFAFYKYRVGDATLHGALLDLFMKEEDYAQFSWIPYGHNTNDIIGYPPEYFFTECGNVTANLARK